MNKVVLNPENTKELNSLKRDPDGAKSQRIWFSNHKNLGLDLGRTKKSFFYKYKSPLGGKFMIYTFKSFTNTEVIDKVVVKAVLLLYMTVDNQVTMSGLDPLALRDEEREKRAKEKADTSAADKVDKALVEKREHTLNDAFDVYCNHMLFKDKLAPSTPGARVDNMLISNSNNIPEPSTLLLMGLGFAGLASTRKRKVA